MPTDTLELNISKAVDELKGTDDVIRAPRSWSPKDLKEVCVNIKIENHEDLKPIERLVLEFIIKDFFFLQHQTGLYNLQREVWSHLAKVKKIKITRVKNPFWVKPNEYQLSDINLTDRSTGKFIKIRLLHPNAQINSPQFDNFINIIPRKCIGLFYISDQELPEKIISKVLQKTNSDDFVDKYRSPISKNCSLNLIHYREIEANNKYEFSLIHPNLERKVASEICLAH